MDSPTPRPQDNIGDCTPQLCNVHCPHQCFLYLSEASPPPPPPPRRHQSTANLSPEIIIITVTAAASFFFLACFLLAFKFCGNHRSPAPSHAPPAAAAAAPSPSTGLDDSLVQQIPSFTHSSVDGPLGDEVDCAVCLHDFADGDRLRRLPKCRHTFHQICVDTWLKSHSSCPICRAAVCEADVLMEERGEAAGEVVVVVDEVEEMEEGGRQH